MTSTLTLRNDMLIRSLDPAADRTCVDAFFADCADYVRLERGTGPGPDVTEEFFTDTPPGCDPATNLRLGLFDDIGLIGIADLAFGFPTATDGYIGLMMITPAQRGTGAGAVLLRHMEAAARARHCSAIYLGVLDANPKGRAFWQREGFMPTRANGRITLGQLTHIAHRLGKPL